MGYIYKTTNGGSNWSYPTPPNGTGSLNSIYFTNSSIGYIVGANGVILKSTNSGVNWSSLSSPTTNNLNSIYFIDANTGFAVGDAGMIIKTTNAGVNWIVQSSGTTYNLNSVILKSDISGYAVGDNGTILKYTGNVSVNENKISDFNIYPNPVKSNGKITISSTDNIQNVKIFNIKGEQVIFRNFENENEVELELGSLAIGMYIVKINDLTVKKIVVQ